MCLYIITMIQFINLFFKTELVYFTHLFTRFIYFVLKIGLNDFKSLHVCFVTYIHNHKLNPDDLFKSYSLFYIILLFSGYLFVNVKDIYIDYIYKLTVVISFESKLN